MALAILRPDRFAANDTDAFFAPVQTPLQGLGRNGELTRLEGYEIKPTAIMTAVAQEPLTIQALFADVISKPLRRLIVPDMQTLVTELPPEIALQDISRGYTGTSGMTSITDPSSRIKYIDSSIPLGVPPGELARAYLKRIKAAGQQHWIVDSMDAARIGYRKDALPFLNVPAPVFYQPGPIRGRHRGEFAYIDLAAAYWQLMRYCTLDMVYRPREPYLGHGIIPFWDTENLLSHKGIRVSLLGTARSYEIGVYVHGKYEVLNLRRGAIWLAPDLVGCVMHWMHAIAAEIIDTFGAVMVLTDAYIVPASLAENVINFLRDRWHIPARIDGIGDSGIYAVGCYQVGAKKSKHAPAKFTLEPSALYGALPEPNPVDTLEPGIREISPWLQSRREWLVSENLQQYNLHEKEINPFASFNIGALEQEQRECERCGESIPEVLSRGARFCSGSCQDAARKARARNRVKEQKSCKECGDSLPEVARANMRYCSKRCKNAAQRKM